MADRITRQPQRIYTDSNRVNIRAGQWNLKKPAGRSSIFIQNNYYGDMGYRGWGDAWAGGYEPYERSGWDKFADAMMIISGFVSAAGSIWSSFKKDS